MNHTTLLLVFALLSVSHALPCPLRASCRAVERKPESARFCAEPPTVAPLPLRALQGAWWATHASGVATRITLSTCIISTNALAPSGNLTINECFDISSSDRQCGRSTARASPTGSGSLDTFDVTQPVGPLNPGRYNVVAVVGPPARRLAYAVFQCVVDKDGVARSGLFLLSRTRLLPDLLLRTLKDQLTCAGYDVPDAFVTVDNNNCE